MANPEFAVDIHKLQGAVGSLSTTSSSVRIISHHHHHHHRPFTTVTALSPIPNNNEVEAASLVVSPSPLVSKPVLSVANDSTDNDDNAASSAVSRVVTQESLAGPASFPLPLLENPTIDGTSAVVAVADTAEPLSLDYQGQGQGQDQQQVDPFEFSAPESTFQSQSQINKEDNNNNNTDDDDDSSFFQSLSQHLADSDFSDNTNFIYNSSSSSSSTVVCSGGAVSLDPLLLASFEDTSFADQVDRISESSASSSFSSPVLVAAEGVAAQNNNYCHHYDHSVVVGVVPAPVTSQDKGGKNKKKNKSPPKKKSKSSTSPKSRGKNTSAKAQIVSSAPPTIPAAALSLPLARSKSALTARLLSNNNNITMSNNPTSNSSAAPAPPPPPSVPSPLLPPPEEAAPAPSASAPAAPVAPAAATVNVKVEPTSQVVPASAPSPLPLRPVPAPSPTTTTATPASAPTAHYPTTHHHHHPHHAPNPMAHAPVPPPTRAAVAAPTTAQAPFVPTPIPNAHAHAPPPPAPTAAPAPAPVTHPAYKQPPPSKTTAYHHPPPPPHAHHHTHHPHHYTPAPPPAASAPSAHPPPHAAPHSTHPPPHPGHPTIPINLPPITIPAPTPSTSIMEPATPNSTSGNSNSNNGNSSPNNPQVNGIAENTGRWTAEEHRLFLQGLEQHGKGWKKIAGLIKSRTVVQIRTHAQKYFQKLAKARQSGEGVPGGVVVGANGVGGGVGVPGTGVGGMNHLDGSGASAGVAGAMGGVTMSTVDGYSITSTTDGSGGKGSIGMAIVPTSARAAAAVAAGGGVLAASAGGMALTHHHVNGKNSGNMSMGTDPTSLAVAAAGMVAVTGTSTASSSSKRRRASQSGSKRRAIGSVVRSAVREGRNVKRQKIAETKRNAAAAGESATTAAIASASVPNPLPAISNILDPYVASAVAAHQHATSGKKSVSKSNARGRNQLVQTATHGTLPMASLEDAVFRLLTPATGAPAPPLPPGSTTTPPNPAIMDPLAPNQVKPPMTHTQYGVPNSSPTCVADVSTFPSWVDAKNPPQWYNEGADIDQLLEDADCLNWLNDTGDLEENYAAPPMDMDFNVDPTSVTSNEDGTQPSANLKASSSYADTPSLLSTDGTTTDVEPTAIKMEDVVDPTFAHVGGVVHPSGDSLSFLVDDEDAANHLPLQGFMNTADPLSTGPTDNMAMPYASATEAVEAHGHDSKLSRDESHGGLMGFPDLGMGDEQAFVSALLEDNQSSISFPKLHSDLGVHVNNGQSGIGLSEAAEAQLKEDIPR